MLFFLPFTGLHASYADIICVGHIYCLMYNTQSYRTKRNLRDLHVWTGLKQMYATTSMIAIAADVDIVERIASRYLLQCICLLDETNITVRSS